MVQSQYRKQTIICQILSEFLRISVEGTNVNSPDLTKVSDKVTGYIFVEFHLPVYMKLVAQKDCQVGLSMEIVAKKNILHCILH